MHPDGTTHRSPLSILKFHWLLSICLLISAIPWAAQADEFASVYDAEVVDSKIKIFRSMAMDNQYEMSITYKNTGTEPWSSGYPVRLEVKASSSSWGAWGTTGRVPQQEALVTPGKEATFIFTVTSFPNAGFHPFKVQMIKEGDRRFGEVLEASIEISDMSQHVVVDGEGFREEGSPGRPWVPVGATMGLWYEAHSPECDGSGGDAVRGPGQQFWCEWVRPLDDTEPPTAPGISQAAQNVEEALQDVARQGGNVVRLGGIGQLLETSAGTFDGKYCDRFNDMLDLAGENGIRVIINMPGPTRWQSLYNQEFCQQNPEIDCFQGQFPDLKSVILNENVRNFTIERMWNFVDQCGLLERPEVFSYRLFDEPTTSGYEDRNRDFLVKLWNKHLVDDFGCVDAALDAWGFDLAQPSTHPAKTCGTLGNELCPPSDNVFCEERTDAWGQYAREHRRFFDTEYSEAYTKIVDNMKGVYGPKCGPGPCECEAEGCAPQRALMSSSFPTNIYYPEVNWTAAAQCEGVPPYDGGGAAGQWADPSWSSQVFDYVALNVADWRETFQSDEWPILRLWIDYARGDLPVVMHEFGRKWASGGGDSEQQLVSLKQVLNFSDRFVSGGQFHYLRDSIGAQLYGAREILGRPRPVFQDFPLMMSTLKQARNSVQVSPTSITVDPYDKVLLTDSILEHLAAHQAASADGLVRIHRAPEPSHPAPAAGICPNIP